MAESLIHFQDCIAVVFAVINPIFKPKTSNLQTCVLINILPIYCIIGMVTIAQLY